MNTDWKSIRNAEQMVLSGLEDMLGKNIWRPMQYWDQEKNGEVQGQFFYDNENILTNKIYGMEWAQQTTRNNRHM